jgi:CheY-like chemotaxis protein
MMLRAGPESNLRQDIELIKATGERAAKLTRQLLQFSRQQVLQPRIASLWSIVSEMEEMLRRLIGEHIELHILPRKATRKVKIDLVQMQQVIMNLVVNARDAMSNGGKIIIEIADVDLDEEYARTHVDVKAGPHLMLAVSDNGCGMSPETQARLFEPFFTTKEQGKGTGLGLSTVYGIVKQSGGHIWVYSEPGKGTSFKVYFPAAHEKSAEVSNPVLPLIQSGGETILVAEDEEPIAALVQDILSARGYKVLVALTVDEAIRLSEQKTENIHLLLTDIVMPKFSGKELARRIRQTRPSMKVLYMSGYTNDTIVHHGVLEDSTEFLEKPFTPSVLARRVREVLDGRSA